MKRGKTSLCYLIVCAVLILSVIIFSISWPVGNKTLGNEYTSHIYANSSFRLMSVFTGDDYQLFSFNYDYRFDDTFRFEFDKTSDSYRIMKLSDDEALYLGTTSDNELIMSPEGSGETFCWHVNRVGNSMYYMIVNDAGYALCETEDSRAVMAPADEENVNMHMRLQ